MRPRSRSGPQGELAVSMVPFNRPYVSGREFDYIKEAIAQGHLSGDGAFTRRCHAWLEETVGCARALLTHSCTAALRYRNSLKIVCRIPKSWRFRSVFGSSIVQNSTSCFRLVTRPTSSCERRRGRSSVVVVDPP